jgi:hypothetical protein
MKVRRDEILSNEDGNFMCLVEMLTIPKDVSKKYLLWLCTEGVLKEVKV